MEIGQEMEINQDMEIIHHAEIFQDNEDQHHTQYIVNPLTEVNNYIDKYIKKIPIYFITIY